MLLPSKANRMLRKKLTQKKERQDYKMDILEKVEALREKANISYEEAKNILDVANGDLLEAMVLLERQGKIRKPETELMRSDAEDASDNTASEETVEKKDISDHTADESDHTADEKAAAAGNANAGTKNSECNRQKVKRAVRKLIEVLKNNSLHVTRKEENIFILPAWAFALILLFAWKPLLIIMLVSLFFQVRYSIEGKNDLQAANDFLNKVGNMAEEVAGEFNG